jgi:hypothetical protein
VQNQREKKSKAQRANEACRSFSFISPVQNKWATDGTCAWPDRCFVPVGLLV